MVMAIVLPFLAVLAAQTWYIDSGRAKSPPSTVQGTGMIGYYIVQLILLGLALGTANQLRIRRNRTRARTGAGAHSAGMALAVNAVVAFVVAGSDLFISLSIDHGTHMHPAQGTPPAIGMLGALLCAVVFAGLAIVNRRYRRAEVAHSPLSPASSPVMQ
jgi:drug/metabolite transporter (DMT)-like permease